MSIIPKETIQVIAQSIGIHALPDEVASALAPEVEYRMREIMQEAIKCMLHSKRTILTTDDVNSALQLRNVEPLYGFASGRPLRFKKALGHTDLFYVDDGDVELKEVMEAPLPKVPIDTAVVAHWLAIDGIQPAIPENVPLEELKKAETTVMRKKDEDLVELKLPVRHVLSQELQLYFEKITELIINGSTSDLFKAALNSVATDSGLHPLVPYFTQFVADEVVGGLDDLQLLFALMRVVHSLLLNPHIQIDLYLHQLMPAIMTCLVAKRLGGKSTEGHWELRDYVARLIAFICRRYGDAYVNLQPRISKTLLQAFLDPKRAMTQHYGSIKGLAALGPRVVSLLVLPYVEPYLELLLPELSMETQKNEMKRYEAMRVYGALLNAVGQCMSLRLKSYPMFLLMNASKPLSGNNTFYEALVNSSAKKRTAGVDDNAIPNQKKVLIRTTSEPEAKSLMCENPRGTRQETCDQNVEDTEMGEPEAEVCEKNVEDNDASVGKHVEDTDTDANKHGEADTEMTCAALNSTTGKDESCPIIERSDEEEGKLCEKLEITASGMDINLVVTHGGEDGMRSEKIEDMNDDNLHVVVEQNDAKEEERTAMENAADESVGKGGHKKLVRPHHVEGRFGLLEVWKEDAALGPLLASLVELFGDALLPFVPNHELSFFV